MEGATFRKESDGINPGGTKNLRSDYGAGMPILSHCWLSQVAPSMLQSQNADSYVLLEKAMNGLVSGRQTGPFFLQPLRPNLTPDESEKVSEILTPRNTYVRGNMVKFMKGDRSFNTWATWEDFAKDIRRLGDIDWVMNLYNSKVAPGRAKRDYSSYWD